MNPGPISGEARLLLQKALLSGVFQSAGFWRLHRKSHGGATGLFDCASCGDQLQEVTSGFISASGLGSLLYGPGMTSLRGVAPLAEADYTGKAKAAMVWMQDRMARERRERNPGEICFLQREGDSEGRDFRERSLSAISPRSPAASNAAAMVDPAILTAAVPLTTAGGVRAGPGMGSYVSESSSHRDVRSRLFAGEPTSY